MNVLVTGSNGFVGSWIVKILRSKYNVIGCGRSISSKIDVDDYVKWDIGKEECPTRILNMKIDIVVHAAACKDMDDYNDDLIYTNCMGTYRIYQLVEQCKVKKLILISGIPVIGIPNNVITELTAVNPRTVYHVTKVFQELLLNQLNLKNSTINVINLRIPSPIGPGQPVTSIVPVFLNQALKNENIIVQGKGTRRQNYIDVRDVALAVNKIIMNASICGIYNLGVDYTVSNLELARMCIKLADSCSEIEFSGTKDACDNQVWNIDSTKLKHGIDFETSYSIQQTLKDMLMFMKRQQEL